MFFIIGITQKSEEIDSKTLIICNNCGAYGRYRVYMTYTCLTLFFIPCFKWGRKYYVQTTCCQALYELDPEIGQALARGEDVEILPKHLTRINAARKPIRHCPSCGYDVQDHFEYCPKCGRKL